MASPQPSQPSTYVSKSRILGVLALALLLLPGAVARAGYSDAVTSLGPVGYWRFDDPPGPNRVAFFDEYGPNTGSYERRGKVRNGYQEGFEESATQDGDQAVWLRGNCKESQPGLQLGSPGFAWVPGWTSQSTPNPLPPIPPEFNTPEGTITMFVMPTDFHKADGVFFSRDHVSPAIPNENSIEIMGNPVTTGIMVDIEGTTAAGTPVSRRLQQIPYGGNNHQDWYHVAVTWKSSGGNRGVRFYVEGELIVEDTDLILDLTNNPDPMIIGASQKFSPPGQDMPLDNNLLVLPYCGGVDELAIFDYQLTESQIQELLASDGAIVSSRDVVISGNNTDTVAGTWQMRPGHVYSYRFDPDAPFDGVVNFPLIPGQILGTSSPICTGEQNCDLHGIHIRDNGNLIGTFTTGPSFVTYAGVKDDPKFPHLRLRPREVFEYNPHVQDPNAPAGSPALGPVTTSLWGDPIPPGTAVKLVDESIYSNNISVDIDAVSVSRDPTTRQELNLLFSTVQNMSTDKGLQSGLVGWKDHDIVEWNGSSQTRNGLAAGQARIFWSAGFEPPNNVFKRDEDIDAFGLLPNGLYILSTTSSSSGGSGLSSLGRRYFRDGDVIEFNAGTTTIDGLPPGKARKIVDERVAFATDSHVDTKAIHMQPFMEGFTFEYSNSYGTACHPKRISVSTRDTQGDPHQSFGDKGEVTEIILRDESGALISDQFDLTVAGHGFFSDIFGVPLADPTNVTSTPIYFTWEPDNDGLAEFDLVFKHPAGFLDIDIEQVGRRWVSDNDDTTIAFYPYGLTIAAGDGQGGVAPYQYAGVPFSPTVTAYGLLDGGECGVIEAYEGTKSLHAWMTHVDPVGGAERIVYGGDLVAGRAPLSIPYDNWLTAIAEALTPNLTLEFSQGVATFGPLRYDDAGRVSLCLVDMVNDENTFFLTSQPHATWTANCDLGSVVPVVGMNYGPFGEGSFVVAPHHFDVAFSQPMESGSGAPAQSVVVGDGPANPIFARAGESFEVTVTAMTADFDGNGGVPTKSYGFECQDFSETPTCVPEDVRLHAEIAAPSHAGVHNPEIEPESTGLIFNFNDGNRDGIAVATFSYGDVGIVDVTANVADADWDWNGDGSVDTPAQTGPTGYLGSGAGANAYPVETLGRFIPYQFRIANRIDGVDVDGATTSDTFIRAGCENYVDTSDPLDGIPDADYSFTYAGQSVSGQIHLQAINKAGAVTQNYVNAWAKLNPFDADLSDDNGMSITDNTTGGFTMTDQSYDVASFATAMSGGTPIPLDWSAAPTGTATLVLDIDYGFRGAPHDLELRAQLSDLDLQSFYTARAGDITPLDHLLGGTVTINGPEYRWGRLNIPNAYGPESDTNPLEVPMILEIFHNIGGGVWIANSEEGLGASPCSCLGLEEPADDLHELLAPHRALGRVVAHLGDGQGGSTPDFLGLAPLAAADSMGTERPGQATLHYERPGAGNQFTFALSYPLDTLAATTSCTENPTWLQYDWDGNGVYDDNPEANITFGIFRTSRKRVFMREVY